MHPSVPPPIKALHSEWRLWCNSEVHALHVVAAQGLPASVTLYLASPRTSVARVVRPALPER
jgi:hypothetical protein